MAKLTRRQNGLVHWNLCARCMPLPDSLLPVNRERDDGPSPLLVGLIAITFVVGMLAWAWTMLMGG
jgi:hypothetical protein